MSIDIGGLLTEGFERTVARNGLLYAAIFYVLAVPSAMLSADVNRQMGTAEMTTSQAPPLGLSPVVAGVLSLVIGLVTLVVTVGAIRTFVTEERERITSEQFTRNIAWVVLNLIVGGFIFSVVVGIGFVFLIIPGLFLLVSLFFWNFFVIVEDENFVDGFQSSWAATSGSRLALFALGVVVAIIALIVNLVFGIPGIVLPDTIGFLVTQIGGAITQVFFLATAARTYVQLTAPDREPETPSPREHAVE